jgi:hypothetical protein
MTNPEFERQARESMRIGVAGPYDLHARDSVKVTVTVPKPEPDRQKILWVTDGEY